MFSIVRTFKREEKEGIKFFELVKKDFKIWNHCALYFSLNTNGY